MLTSTVSFQKLQPQSLFLPKILSLWGSSVGIYEHRDSKTFFVHLLSTTDWSSDDLVVLGEQWKWVQGHFLMMIPGLSTDCGVEGVVWTLQSTAHWRDSSLKWTDVKSDLQAKFFFLIFFNLLSVCWLELNTKEQLATCQSLKVKSQHSFDFTCWISESDILERTIKQL